MYYKLLGMVVWHGGKFMIRRRYGIPLSKPLLAGAAVTRVATKMQRESGAFSPCTSCSGGGC